MFKVSFFQLKMNQARDLGMGVGFTKLSEFREVISFRIRYKLLLWHFQPANRDLNAQPFLSFAWIIRFPIGTFRRKYPGKYFKLLTNFWKYRRNLRGISWSSLSMIYPRSLTLWYYYLLFWWAEYCGVLPELLERPDLSLIPELFIRYIAEIDAIIDRKGGKEYLLSHLPDIKIRCENLLRELLARIWGDQHALPVETRKKLSHKIWRFRQNSLVVSMRAQSLPKLSFDEMLAYKDATAAELFRLWVELLCDLYQVNSRVENSKTIMAQVAMAIQVIDDILDSPLDYHNDVINIFNHLLKDNPAEYLTAQAYFERYPDGYMDWVWANKYLPQTCRKAVDLLSVYLTGMASISTNPDITSEFREVLKVWKVLNP